MYVVFKRCLPLFTLSIGVCVLRNGLPSVGVVIAVLITTGGAALAGKNKNTIENTAELQKHITDDVIIQVYSLKFGLN